MRRFFRMAHTLTSHPWMVMAINLVLLVAAVAETFSTLESDMAGNKLRAHHGLLLFAGFQLLSTLAQTLSALGDAVEATEEVTGTGLKAVGDEDLPEG